jgi:CYTH domain-containing protein
LGQKYRSAGQETQQRTMTTIYLNELEYKTLTSLKGSSIIKRRYPYTYTGYPTSVDVFEGHLSGLLLLEFQQQAGEDITSFPAPEFAVREVTDEPFFTGGELAKLTKEEFQRWFHSW